MRAESEQLVHVAIRVLEKNAVPIRLDNERVIEIKLHSFVVILFCCVDYDAQMDQFL